MKITASIYDIETLKNLANLIDFAVLMVSPYSQIYGENLDIDEAINVCNENEITPIISISKMMMEDEIKDFSSFINKYSKYLFLVSDLGVIQLMKEKGLINNVIYDSSTMVCNSLDYEVYSSYGFNAISLSNEIPLNDVYKIINKDKNNIFYQVFGYKQMFYSKRKLLSLYENHSLDKFSRDNLKIKEEKRDELMPIIENKNGFFVYRSYIISLLKEIKELSNLKYAYFDSIFLKCSTFAGILKIFKDYLSLKISEEEALKLLEESNLNTSYGFEYSDTIHMKEKIINE